MINKNTKSKIIAVDFDGTLCTNDYPEIGEPNLDVINYLKEQKKEGAKLILWTCRRGVFLTKAEEWCADKGLTFDSINENLPEVIKIFGSDTRKIFANEYIDDRNLFLVGKSKYVEIIEIDEDGVENGTD